MITAGHCCFGNPASSLRVVAGDHNLDDDAGTEQSRDVVKVTAHEDFSMILLNDDICLLELAEPLEFNECVIY